MLYVFKNTNGVQIAWNSELPRSLRNARSSNDQRRSSLFGFIRTWNVG